MPYLAIEGFPGGIDQRRSKAMGVPGTLWDLRNAHIGPGGEIERCLKWVKQFDLPAGCFGLIWSRFHLWTFGSSPPSSLPAGLSFHQVSHPQGAPMSRLVTVEQFNGKFYVIADFANGDTVHFYNGNVVNAIWNGEGQFSPSLGAVAAKLADLLRDAGWMASSFSTGATATVIIEGGVGQAFDVSASATNRGSNPSQLAFAITTQAASLPADVARASSSFVVSAGASGVVNSITVNGAPLITSPVPGNADKNEWAAEIVAAINAGSSGFQADRSGGTITLLAPPGYGDSINGVAPAISQVGGFVSSASPFSGGITGVGGSAQRSEVRMSGLFEVQDEWRIVVNGQTFGPVGGRGSAPRVAHTHDDKMYVAAGAVLSFSKISDPTTFYPHTDGAGFVTLSNHMGGMEDISGLATFGQSLAVFSPSAVQIWQTDPDPTKTIRLQTMASTGALSGQSVASYRGADVFYLSHQGIRTVKPRTDTPLGDVDDIGAPIDRMVIEYLQSLPPSAASRARSAIDPVTGRFLLAVGNRAFTLSYYKASKVSGWSVYEMPAAIDSFAVGNDRLYALGEDRGVYIYGGASGTEQSDGEVVAELPHITLGRPASMKTLKGIDVVAPDGVWTVDIVPDPNSGRVSATTRGLRGVTAGYPNNPIAGITSHLSLLLKCNSKGPARFAALAIHFDLQESE